jgi:lipooligosaccharide transport system permease protein
MSVSTPGPFRVVSGHVVVFRRLWQGNVVSSFVQPILYLLGLGVGVGALVDRNGGSADTLGGLSYVAFVAPGLLVTSAMAISANESMWPVQGGLKWRRDYHSVVATPLGARDIVLGHGLWMAIRTGIGGVAVALALALFDDTRSWGLAPSVVVAMVIGVAFAMPIMAYSVTAQMDGGFAAIQRFVIIPLFLFGGAFYPLSQLPIVVQWVARVFPLWHGVVVARSFTTGLSTGDVDWIAVGSHLAYVSVWIAIGTVLSIRNLHRELCP